MKSFRKYLQSFTHALRGISISVQQEQSMLYNLAGALAVIIINLLLEVSRWEWIITLILIEVVLMAEIFNTAIERLSDRVSKEHDELIRDVKDLSSAAVVVMGFIAGIVAMIIYLPYLKSVF